MEFKYDEITMGDLDIELNYANFGFVCDGDRQVVRCGIIEDGEDDES